MNNSISNYSLLQDQIQAEVLKNLVKDVSSTSRLILNRIVSLYNDCHYVYISQSTLAMYAGCTREYANVLIRQLEEKGLLVKVYRHMRTCLYKIVPSFERHVVRETLKGLLPALARMTFRTAIQAVKLADLTQEKGIINLNTNNNKYPSAAGGKPRRKPSFLENFPTIYASYKDEPPPKGKAPTPEERQLKVLETELRATQAETAIVAKLFPTKATSLTAKGLAFLSSIAGAKDLVTKLTSCHQQEGSSSMGLEINPREKESSHEESVQARVCADRRPYPYSQDERF